jgi:hypothetical protein
MRSSRGRINVTAIASRQIAHVLQVSPVGAVLRAGVRVGPSRGVAESVVVATVRFAAAFPQQSWKAFQPRR